jgi:dethiobiotin synthetase
VKFQFPPRFFVTGTDTGVGKTLACALLARGLGHHYWKPVQSGSLDGLDSTMVQKMAGLKQNLIVPENYVLKQPLSPHLAAEIDGISIDINLIHLARKPEFLIIEGAGGVMTPLNENSLILDLIKKLAVPVLIISLNRLGTINHTLLTIDTLFKADLDIMGVILNRAVNIDHKEAIEHYGKVPVLAQLEHLDPVTPEKLEEKFSELFL